MSNRKIALWLILRRHQNFHNLSLPDSMKSEEEMMKVRNLGRKSLKEVVQKLLASGMSVESVAELLQIPADLLKDGC